MSYGGQVKLPSSSALKEIMDAYKRKIEAGILPPDPMRILEAILRAAPTIEHLLPIPPILEYIHSTFTQPVVESLPRLPMTSDYPAYEWLKWYKEELRL